MTLHAKARSRAHVPHAGAIQDVLKAAAQIEKLEFLDLQGQAFSGTLPTQYSFPNLMELNLINNNIGVGLQIFDLSYESTLQKGTSAGAAPSMCMRYAGLCMHTHQALQDLICTEPLTAAFHCGLHSCCGDWLLARVGPARQIIPEHLVPSLTACCGMQGILPAEWGLNGMFPKLTSLSLSYNPPLSGSLPTDWGSDNSTFQSLRLFEANNCNLTGGLPAEWAAQLHSLTHINISSNALTGLFCGLERSSLPLTCSASFCECPA